MQAYSVDLSSRHILIIRRYIREKYLRRIIKKENRKF